MKGSDLAVHGRVSSHGPTVAIASREVHPPDVDLRTRWLGRVAFADALALQEDLVARKWVDRSFGDELLLLEHEPVYTIGRTPDQSSLRGAAHLPYPLFPINRGGQATYHGPGQLIGYPIIDLRQCGQDLHRYLRWIEALLTETLAEFEIAAAVRPGLTGVWVEDRKIASIGVGVRHWIAMHGFALNVCGDLAPFDQIVPCGIANVAMTSIERETGTERSVAEVSSQVEEIAVRRISDLRKSAPRSRADADDSPKSHSLNSLQP
jgi:lipoyl(octanoyl) transferase